jgi:hypothetical protein
MIILVKSEATWPAVLTLLLSHHNSENVLLSSKVFLSRSPDRELVLAQCFLLLLVGVHSRKEHSIKTNVSCKSSKSFRDSEGVYLPSYVWLVLNSYFLLKESMTGHKIIDDIVVAGTCLIRCREPTINDVELFIFNKIPHRIPLVLILFVPPHFEELHLSVCERLILVSLQSLYHS